LSLHASSLHFPPPHPLTNHHPSPITHPTTPYPPLTSTAHPPSQNPQTLSNHFYSFPPKPSSHTPTVDIVDIVTRFRRKIPHFRSNLPSLLTVVVLPRLHLPFLPVGKPISKKKPLQPHCNTPYKKNKTKTKRKTKNEKRKRTNQLPPPFFNDLLPAPISQPPSLRICERGLMSQLARTEILRAKKGFLGFPHC